MTTGMILAIVIPLLVLIGVAVLAFVVIFPQREAAQGVNSDELDRRATELDRRATALDETEQRYAGALSWLMQQLGLDDQATKAPSEIAISFDKRQSNGDEVAEHLVLHADGSFERESWITAGIDCRRKEHPTQTLSPEMTKRLHGIIGQLVNDGLRQEGPTESGDDGMIALSVTFRLGAWAFVSRIDANESTQLPTRWQELYRELDEILPS